MKTGTLKELNVKPGDVVEWVGYEHVGHHTLDFIDGELFVFDTKGGPYTHTLSCADIFRIISRVSEEAPKTWGEMTREEKGELLLAAHEGKVIEFSDNVDPDDWCAIGGPSFVDRYHYRVKPEPKRETVTLYAGHTDPDCDPMPIGTIDLINDKPDYASIKMEEV